jgi:hypothetical protein
MRKMIITLGILLTAVFIYNCGDEIVTTDKDIVFPDTNVSYQNHVQRFLLLKCSYRGCHSSEDRQGGRDMTTYYALFETANIGLINLISPEHSRLIQILNANPEHQSYFVFPKGYFIENHVNGMTQWIKEGAKFN